MRAASYSICGAFILTFLIGCGPENLETENSNNSPHESIDNAERAVSIGANFSRICDAIVEELDHQAPIFTIANLQRRFLELHNRDRQRFGLEKLTWDSNLASYAQRWANYLKDNHGCEMHHRSKLGQTEGKTYGENLAFYWTGQKLPQGTFGSSPDMAVNNWDSECADYDLVSNTCAAGKMCGHFTQVVWEKSKRVGCAVATCNAGDRNYNRSGRAEIWVCNYDPPGNMSISQGGVITKLKPFSETAQLPKETDGTATDEEPELEESVVGTSTHRVVLYGNPGCIFCQMSEEALKKEGIAYEFNNINADVHLRNKIVSEVGAKRFPYVFVDGKYVGGLPELQSMIANKELGRGTGAPPARPPATTAQAVREPPQACEPPSKGGALGQSANRVVLYGNPGCGLCKAAESLLRENGISYDFNNVWQDNALLQRLHNEIGPQKFPYVFVDKKHIGGLAELQALVASKGLDKKPARAPRVKPTAEPTKPAARVTQTQAPTKTITTTTLGQSSKNVVLYGNPNCGLCVAAENLLKEKKIPYDFVDIWSNTALLQQLHQEIGPHRFPYVFVGGEHIGGLQELTDMINANKLTVKAKPTPKAQPQKPKKQQPAQVESRKGETKKAISKKERARLAAEAKKRRANEQLFRK